MLCRSQGIPIAFWFQQLSAWCIFWIQCGFKAATLKNHFTAFARVADETNQSFPVKDGWTHKQLKRMRRGLRKLDRTSPDRATPLTRIWIKRMLAANGVRTLRDAAGLHAEALVFITRLMVANGCMMRMCEHEMGSDVTDVTFHHNEGNSIACVKVWEVKDKLRTGQFRLCCLPIHDDVGSPGRLLMLMMDELHRRAQPGDMLWAQMDADGKPTGSPASKSRFVRFMREWARKAKMPEEMVAKLRGHSLRSGGATDWLNAGRSEAWVMRQGGWLSSIFRIYYRPDLADFPMMAAALKEAEMLTWGKQQR